MNLLADVSFSAGKTVAVLCAIGALACIDIMRRMQHKRTTIFMAAVLGTILSLGLIRTVDVFLQPGVQDNVYAMALALVLAVIGWRALFSVGDVETKLVMLTSFLFWVSLHMFWQDSAQDWYVRLIAAGTALIPAAGWCWLFLRYHRERLSSVALLFLAGVLSTVPILFYDQLVRRGVEMQFFLFRVKPESFNQAAQTFVNGQLTMSSGISSVFIATLLSFFFVALIEEVSKYWVVSRSGKQIFTSIDDVMQLSIIVAIGFAFAENIVNPVYFSAFVRQYLLHGGAPDIAGFVSNVSGRAVLTSMVHIVSTGVMGYFLGVAVFAAPLLEEQHKRGRVHQVLHWVHRTLRIPEVSLFRVHMLTYGLLSAIALHGAFNFLVTIPELLPGSPQSIADLIGPSAPSFLESIPLLLIPALLYVVGGFWLLTTLFTRVESMQERGHVITKEVVVPILEEA